MSTARGARRLELADSREKLKKLPLYEIFELPGRPHVVYMLRSYGEHPNATEAAEQARNDVPFLFKAFETGQIGPKRMAKMHGGKPRMSTIHEYLDWTVTAQAAQEDDELDFGGFRVLVLLPRYVSHWPAPGAPANIEGKRVKDMNKEDVKLGAPRLPYPMLQYHGRPLCAATIRSGPDYLEIPFVATHESKRGRGYCRCLLEAIEDIARCIEIKRLMLCSTNDPIVKSTWYHLGFDFTTDEQMKEFNMSHSDMVYLQNTTQMHKQVPPPGDYKAVRIKQGLFQQRVYARTDEVKKRGKLHTGAPPKKAAPKKAPPKKTAPSNSQQHSMQLQPSLSTGSRAMSMTPPLLPPSFLPGPSEAMSGVSFGGMHMMGHGPAKPNMYPLPQASLHVEHPPIPPVAQHTLPQNQNQQVMSGTRMLSPGGRSYHHPSAANSEHRLAHRSSLQSVGVPTLNLAADSGVQVKPEQHVIKSEQHVKAEPESVAPMIPVAPSGGLGDAGNASGLGGVAGFGGVGNSAGFGSVGSSAGGSAGLVGVPGSAGLSNVGPSGGLGGVGMGNSAGLGAMGFPGGSLNLGVPLSGLAGPASGSGESRAPDQPPQANHLPSANMTFQESMKAMEEQFKQSLQKKNGEQQPPPQALQLGQFPPPAPLPPPAAPTSDPAARTLAQKGIDALLNSQHPGTLDLSTLPNPATDTTPKAGMSSIANMPDFNSPTLSGLTNLPGLPSLPGLGLPGPGQFGMPGPLPNLFPPHLQPGTGRNSPSLLNLDVFPYQGNSLAGLAPPYDSAPPHANLLNNQVPSSANAPLNLPNLQTLQNFPQHLASLPPLSVSATSSSQGNQRHPQ